MLIAPMWNGHFMVISHQTVGYQHQIPIQIGGGVSYFQIQSALRNSSKRPRPISYITGATWRTTAASLCWGDSQLCLPLSHDKLDWVRETLYGPSWLNPWGPNQDLWLGNGSILTEFFCWGCTANHMIPQGLSMGGGVAFGNLRHGWNSPNWWHFLDGNIIKLNGGFSSHVWLRAVAVDTHFLMFIFDDDISAYATFLRHAEVFELN